MIKKIKKQYKRYRDSLDFIASIRSSKAASFQGEHIGDNGDIVAAAQQLHAEIYIGRNFISEEDVADDGRMHFRADPHQAHSTYFVVKNTRDNKIVATSRQIMHDPVKRHNSFPLLEKAEVDQKWRNYILKHGSESVVEISGLAKVRDTTTAAPLYLYRQMWHHSLREKHDLWLMACDVRLFQRLKLILGDAIIQIGQETQYQGGNVIPAIVKPKKSLHALIQSAINSSRTQRYLRLLVVQFFINGLPMHSIAVSDRKSLRAAGVVTKEES